MNDYMYYWLLAAVFFVLFCLTALLLILSAIPTALGAVLISVSLTAVGYYAVEADCAEAQTEFD